MSCWRMFRLWKLQVQEKLVDKLFEECTENTDEVKITGTALFECRNDCKSLCTIYVVIVAIEFTNSTGIGTYFIYYKYMKRDKIKCF